ncbi:unnamed protein product [Musa hybrid cultivar]
MLTVLPLRLLLLLLLLVLTFVSGFSAATPPSSLVVSACAQASYPSVCVRTLAPSSPSTPSDLALAATSASHSTTRGAAAYLRRLTLPQPPSDRATFRDCANLLSDAANQLARAAKELARLNPNTLRSQLGDAQTWASAAMTDQDMCLREITGLSGRTRDAVVAQVTEASHVTSNALYFITRVAATR